jgi:hypothetical protein
MEIAVMLLPVSTRVALRLRMNRLRRRDGRFARGLGVLRQGPRLQASMTVVMAMPSAAIGLVRLMLLGLNTGRGNLAGATPTLAVLIALGSLRALLGFRVFRNRMRG